MELFIYRIPYDGKNYEAMLIPFGDIHVGNKNCNKAKVITYAQWIADNPNAYWWGMGDYADAIIASDESRWDHDCLDPELSTPDEQYAWVERIFEPIKDRCLGLHVGNHDYELQRRHGHKYVQNDLCKHLGVKYLGFDALIRVEFENKKGGKIYVQDICSTHGSTSSRYPGTRLNALQRWSEGFEADIYTMGHVHDKLVHETVYYSMNTNGKLEQKRKIHALTGGFLEGYIEGTVSYVERKNLMPIKTGIVRLSVWPEKQRVRGQA